MAKRKRDDLAAKPKRPPKFNSTWTEVDSLKFQSKYEAACWQALCAKQASGKIRGLQRQVRLPLYVNLQLITTYIADFSYDELDEQGWWRSVIADAKGFKTPMYCLKKKLVKATLGIDIREL